MALSVAQKKSRSEAGTVKVVHRYQPPSRYGAAIAQASGSIRYAGAVFGRIPPVVGRRIPSAFGSLEIERDFLILEQGSRSRALDNGYVDEHVIRAVVGVYESETRGGVEEPYGAGRHEASSCEVGRTRHGAQRQIICRKVRRCRPTIRPADRP
jgi:hypothetical protein